MRALIFGVAGQDGSYLAEFLLSKGYDVLGAARFHASDGVGPNLVDAVNGGMSLTNIDLMDASNVLEVIARFKPDEVYNLAAQSFVGSSWDAPAYVLGVNTVAVATILEACRMVSQDIRFYQASSSEMYGNRLGSPTQTLDTMLMADDMMVPRSPYGISKLGAHHLCRVYRESHGMFAVGGICFNHECVSAEAPLLVRRNGLIDITSPEWAGPYSEGRKPTTVSFDTSGLEVWDGSCWTKVLAMTGKRRRATDPDHAMQLTIARAGSVETTAHHNLLDAEGQKTKARDVAVGDRLLLGEAWPEADSPERLGLGLARFLGYMVADGYVSTDMMNAHYTKNDDALRAEVSRLWRLLFSGTSSEGVSPSGYPGGGEVKHLRLTGASDSLPWLRSLLYMPDKTKRVPRIVLNTDRETQDAFLDAYYAGDGLKAFGDKRWAVKTNSPYLALGLIYLGGLRGMPISVYVEDRDAAHRYFQLNGQLGGGVATTKDPAEVRETRAGRPTNMVYDLETDTGCFMAGVGRVVISNSERRGLQFVTRKVTMGMALVKAGRADRFPIGTLDSCRDWGYAPEYVVGMWKMLQQEKPADYIVATGIAHSVRELVNAAALAMDMPKPGEEYVEVVTALSRPAEIWRLVGDTLPAKERLGWGAKVGFEELVGRMAEADLLRMGLPPVKAYPNYRELEAWSASGPTTAE